MRLWLDIFRHMFDQWPDSLVFQINQILTCFTDIIHAKSCPCQTFDTQVIMTNCEGITLPTCLEKLCFLQTIISG